MTEENERLHDSVGFDYVASLREILQILTYEELAYRIGYSSTGAIASIVKRGHVPNHRHGEAIWVLYVSLFKRKPPMTVTQASGSSEATVLNSACAAIDHTVET